MNWNEYRTRIEEIVTDLTVGAIIIRWNYLTGQDVDVLMPLPPKDRLTALIKLVHEDILLADDALTIHDMFEGHKEDRYIAKKLIRERWERFKRERVLLIEGAHKAITDKDSHNLIDTVAKQLLKYKVINQKEYTDIKNLVLSKDLESVRLGIKLIKEKCRQNL